MTYMLLIYGNQQAWDAVADERGWQDIERIHTLVQDELTASGELVATNPLTTVDAKIVRTRDGFPSVTDGPFTEAKEVLGGYYLIDCATPERAIEIAGRFAEAEFAPIEIRQVGAAGGGEKAR